jgi:hypothetical protein
MDINNITKKLDKIAKDIEYKIDVAMDVTGSEFVTNARKSVTETIYNRNTGRTPNRRVWELTGHLRSSIQYNKNDKGDVKTLELAAGMEYAAAVEAKGYDVISNSIPIAVKDFDKRVKQSMRSAAQQVSRL